MRNPTFKPVGTLPPHPSRVLPCPYGGAPTLTLDTDPTGCQYSPGRATWIDANGRPHPYHGLYLDCNWVATYETFSVDGYRYARRVYQDDTGSYVTIAGTRYRIGSDAVSMVDFDRPSDRTNPRDTGSNTHGFQYRNDTSRDLSTRFEASRARWHPDTDSGANP